MPHPLNHPLLSVIELYNVYVVFCFVTYFIWLSPRHGHLHAHWWLWPQSHDLTLAYALLQTAAKIKNNHFADTVTTALALSLTLSLSLFLAPSLFSPALCSFWVSSFSPAPAMHFELTPLPYVSLQFTSSVLLLQLICSNLWLVTSCWSSRPKLRQPGYLPRPAGGRGGGGGVGVVDAWLVAQGVLWSA